jgi:hypothetical protein
LNKPLHTGVQLLRHFGPGWVMFRLGYAFRQRTGMLRRALPITSWDAQPLRSFLREPIDDPQQYVQVRAAAGARFLFAPEDLADLKPHFERWDAVGGGPVAMADALIAGVFRYFEHHPINLGCPPDWHHNPITGESYPREMHWTQIGDFSGGDIKLVWEPSRFAWVYPLVRAYWRTGNERYPALFWRLLENWKQANPPQQGVNWKCGQEVAIRLMAVCFGLYGFANSPETTPERIASAAQLAAVSAGRIEANLSYALSQRNNHGITEAVGLWTVGLLFGEFRSATRWRETGRQAIERQVRKLIDADGAFSQHSVNYQRVMLDACLWAIRLGERNNEWLAPRCVESVHRAARFLWQLQDEETGRLPRYGQNDGALLLPLSNCPHEDYRPVLQAAAAHAGECWYAAGPWDEAALWLCGHGEKSRLSLRDSASFCGAKEDRNSSAQATAQRTDWHAAAGGYQVLRGEQGHLVTRAPIYRHRPAHADALHVDLWWRGINIALDAGTHSYNALPPWNNPLAGTGCHNTVMVDGRDQMDRAGRFLWLPWLRGRRSEFATSPDGARAYWEGTHNGYERLLSPVTHRRGILRIDGEHWLIVDALESRTEHDCRLHWLLADHPCELDEASWMLTLSTEQGDYRIAVGSPLDNARLDLVRADDETPRGWYAPYYADRQPALSLALEAKATRVLFASVLGPTVARLRIEPDRITTTLGATRYEMALSVAGRGPLIDLDCMTAHSAPSARLPVAPQQLAQGPS